MKFIWSIAIKKGIGRAVQLLVAWLGAQGLEKAGVTIDSNQLTLALMAGSEVLRNLIKTKMKVKWL